MSQKLESEAAWRRELGQRLAGERAAAGLSQTMVAALMGTAASVVSKLESGADVKLSTLTRYCDAIEVELSLALVPVKAPRRRGRAGRPGPRG